MQLLFKMVIFFLFIVMLVFGGGGGGNHENMSKAYLPQASFHHSTHVWSSAFIGSISRAKMSWEKRNQQELQELVQKTSQKISSHYPPEV